MKADPSIKTPKQYIAAVPEDRRAAIQAVHDLIVETVPSLRAHICYGMLGYGPVRYKTKSGCEGDWFVVGLANQRQYMSLYLCATQGGEYLAEANAARLGKVNCGRSCVRFKKLEDLDLGVVAELVATAERLHAAGGGCQ